MANRGQSVRLRQWLGFLIAAMAVAIAVAPLAFSVALHNTTKSAFAAVLIVATLVWTLAFAVYRGMAQAHERWRRKVLRCEIADIRQARLDASETFQDSLNEQNAILERIVEIADTLLTNGIVDPMTALENVRTIASHAHQAMGLVEDAVADVRAETGATSFETVAVDVRLQAEEIVAPFIRSGHRITTSGRRHFAETDPAVLRITIRNLITKAIEHGSQEIDVSIARDNDRVVCTVSDYSTDRSTFGLSAISPVCRSLVAAVDASLDFGYALGWNRYSISLPAAENRTVPTEAPRDVLGSRVISKPVANEPKPRLIEVEPRISFAIDADAQQPEPRAIGTREPLEAR
jgi:hypothetical protein